MKTEEIRNSNDISKGSPRTYCLTRSRRRSIGNENETSPFISIKEKSPNLSARKPALSRSIQSSSYESITPISLIQFDSEELEETFFPGGSNDSNLPLAKKKSSKDDLSLSRSLSRSGSQPSSPLLGTDLPSSAWKSESVNSNHLKLTYRDRVQIIVEFSTEQMKYIEDIKIQCICKDPKNKLLLSGLMEGSRLPNHFAKAIDPTTFFDALRSAHRRIEELSGLLDEVKQLEQDLDLFLKTSYKKPNGDIIGVIKICFTGPIERNKFIVSFEIPPEYPSKPIEGFNIITRWDGSISKTLIETVVRTQPQSGPKILTQICHQLIDLVNSGNYSSSTIRDSNDVNVIREVEYPQLGVVSLD